MNERNEGAAERLEPSSVVLSGLIGGVAFLAAQLAFIPLFDHASPWAALRATAAAVLGRQVLASPGVHPGEAAVAIGVVLALAIAFAFLLDLVCRSIEVAPAVVLGVPFGIALYVLNYYLLAAVFPWLASVQGWGPFAAYAVYGIVTAGAFEALHLRYARRHGTPLPRP